MLSVTEVPGDVKAGLLGYQKTFVESILRHFNDRIQDQRIAVLLRTIFDFRRMPLQNSDAANEILISWGDVEVDEICAMFFPELDPTVVTDEALAMRIYVRDNQEVFLQLKDPSDTSKGRFLALTGPGSIFETLFSRSDVCTKPIPRILFIADYMIAFMWQSCNGERAASHINIAKSNERTLLGDAAFDAVVFNTYNMPELHEINFEPIKEKWLEEGHKHGTFKGATDDSTESSSKVIRRLLAKKTPTFLYK